MGGGQEEVGQEVTCPADHPQVPYTPTLSSYTILLLCPPTVSPYFTTYTILLLYPTTLSYYPKRFLLLNPPTLLYNPSVQSADP